MKNVYKAMGLLAVLCALAALFACTKENPAPSAAPDSVTIRSQAASGDEDLADMVARLSASVVGIATKQNGQQGIGSGVIVSQNGYILTNHHVAAEGTEVTLIFADGTKELANTVWSSQALDLAIVKAEEGTYPAASMGSVENTRVGEQVVAIGTPLALQFQHTVTGGIVSALNRTLQVPSGRSTAFMEQLIQTDVAINPGNSGGPLLNQRGEVIGIVTVRVEEAAGIGFAIPIDIAKPIVEHFLTDGSYVTPKMGAYLFDSEIARYYDANSTMTTGLYVIDVEPGSAAQTAGLRKGDILLRADGRECKTLLDLRYVLFSHKVGETLALEVQREGEVLQISPTLTAAGEEI
ncbi:MAG: S1C family serine protease [Candidatus Spyradocola sp.]